MLILVISVITLLMLKHTVADFILQGPYMYMNKGNVFHPGGWVHALVHGGFTLVTLVWLTFQYIHSTVPWSFVAFLAVICLTEVFYHFIVDFTKVNVCKYFNWTATTSPYFWWATGIDQFLHFLSYIAITLIYISYLATVPL